VEEEIQLSDAMHPIVISMYARGFHELIVHVIQETAMNWWRWTKLPEVGGAVRADVITTHSKPVIPGNVSASEGEKIQKPLYHISGKFLSFILKFPTLCWIFRPQFRRNHLYQKSETLPKNFGKSKIKVAFHLSVC
jgi:hypothetical protein